MENFERIATVHFGWCLIFFLRDSVPHLHNDTKALTFDIQSFFQRSSTSIDILDFVIKNKTRYDAFYNTELGSLLISLGIETLIISGAETNLCCEATARSKYMQGNYGGRLTHYMQIDIEFRMINGIIPKIFIRSE